MLSLFAQLFLSLQDRIAQEVPEIKHIDQDLGQLEYYDQRPPVAFPCVLIDFPTANYSNLGTGIQWAEVNIHVRLGFAPFTSALSVMPDVGKEKALEYYELENKLYEALQGFTANGCVQPIIRTSATTERRNDPYRVREVIFTTATEDDTAQPAQQTTTAGPKIDFN